MLFPEFVPTRTSESSGHQIASPDSSWGNEEPEKITQLSQSSETNAVSKVGPEDAVEYQNLHSSCHVCKKKPTAVILKVNFNFNLEFLCLFWRSLWLRIGVCNTLASKICVKLLKPPTIQIPTPGTSFRIC
jgi:hypothetical protein